MSLKEVPEAQEKLPQKKKKKNNNEKKKGNSVDEKFSIKSHINNGILQYQGKFKQAKVNTISKLVHKLKEPEKISKTTKNPQAKIERYEKVLNRLKHTSPKRLGLLALHYYKSGKNYLADPASTVEQLAVGYYCESKSLNVVLDALRNGLHLDRNDKWKRPTRKLFKKNENDDKNGSKTNTFIETDNVGETKVNKISQELSASEREKQKKPKSKSAKIKFTADEDDVDELKTAEAPTTVDDFFITADGSNYMSNAVVNTTQKDDSDTHDSALPLKKQSHEFVMNGKTRAGQPGKKFERNAGTKRFAGEKIEWNGESKNGPVEVKEERKMDPNLHPSWVAKQKQKPTITEFKGTKITFD